MPSTRCPCSHHSGRVAASLRPLLGSSAVRSAGAVGAGSVLGLRGLWGLLGVFEGALERVVREVRVMHAMVLHELSPRPDGGVDRGLSGGPCGILVRSERLTFTSDSPPFASIAHSNLTADTPGNDARGVRDSSSCAPCTWCPAKCAPHCS